MSFAKRVSFVFENFNHDLKKKKKKKHPAVIRVDLHFRSLTVID